MKKLDVRIFLLAMVWCLAGIVLLGSRLAMAEEVSPSDDFQTKFLDAAKELRCPTCTGLSVLESDATFSVQIKELVKEQVNAGKSKDEVLSFFVERYGPWILRSPPKSGVKLLAWMIPILVLLLVPVLGVTFFVRRRRVVVGCRTRSIKEISDEMESRLNELRSSDARG